MLKPLFVRWFGLYVYDGPFLINAYVYPYVYVGIEIDDVLYDEDGRMICYDIH